MVLDNLSADSRGGNLPRSQSTRFPLSLQRSLNTSEVRENSMDSHFELVCYEFEVGAYACVRTGQRCTESAYSPCAKCARGLGTARVAPNGSSAATAACLPVGSAPSSSFIRSEPTDYLRPMSESERLLRPRTSQPNIAQNNSSNSMVNQLGSQYTSVSSSHSLPGFSQSCQSEIRNEPVYSQSNKPRIESNPMLSYMRRFTSTVPARGARALNRAISNSCL